jgi:glycosyltransferase involved in cell wall biosynthesis
MTSELHLYYHGNLSPRLLPLALIEAMAKARCPVRLTAIGYKTISNENYDRTIADRASTLGIADRVTILPAIPRADLLGRAREFDVGWAVLPVDEQDVNFRYMVGASNKAFDYLACGLALLVTNDPQWKSTFVDQGYGLSCNPEDPDSIAEALTWFCGHREQMRKMGEMGRSRVLEQWNYETQFAPVRDLMDAAVAQST